MYSIRKEREDISIDRPRDLEDPAGPQESDSQSSEESEMIPTIEEDDLFATEGYSQNQSVLQKAVWHSESDSQSDMSSERGDDFGVLEEYEIEKDINQLEDEVSDLVNTREDELIAGIHEAEEHSSRQLKLQMQLGLLYQENGYFDKAIKEFQIVVDQLEKSIQHEDIYHYALRCLCVCLREVHREDDAVNRLNKDIDILVFRKTRNAGGDYRQYYDCELQRSYEELGNTYMR